MCFHMHMWPAFCRLCIVLVDAVHKHIHSPHLVACRAHYSASSALSMQLNSREIQTAFLAVFSELSVAQPHSRAEFMFKATTPTTLLRLHEHCNEFIMDGRTLK